MVQLFILFLLFFIPGFIAVLAYEFICGCKIINCCRNMLLGMIFNLLSLIIMLIGLWIFEEIYTIGDLIYHFTCMHFTMTYAIVIIIVNIGLGVFGGLICRLFCCRK